LAELVPLIEVNKNQFVLFSEDGIQKFILLLLSRNICIDVKRDSKGLYIFFSINLLLPVGADILGWIP